MQNHSTDLEDELKALKPVLCKESLLVPMTGHLWIERIYWSQWSNISLPRSFLLLPFSN